MLFGAPECVAVAICHNGALKAVRCVIYRKKTVIAAAETIAPSQAPLTERLKDLAQRIGLRKDMFLAISSADAEGTFFRTELPEMKRKELQDALSFEAPRHLLASAEGVRTVFWARPAGNEKLSVWSWAVPDGGLDGLFAALEKLRWQCDWILSPYLAAALMEESGEDCILRLPDFDPGFHWRKDTFHPDASGGVSGNRACEFLKKKFELAKTLKEEVWEEYLACLMLASCVVRQEREYPGIRDLGTLPAKLRPRRLRMHLRVTVFLLASCLIMYGGRMFLAASEHYRECSRLTGSIDTTKKSILLFQRKIRIGEKAQKEKRKVLDMEDSGRNFLQSLAKLSRALPKTVLAGDVKLHESGIDLTLYSSQENADMGGVLKAFPEYRVGTLQTRKTGDTLNVITLQLKPKQEKK